MGLDITAYSGITPAPYSLINEDGEYDYKNHTLVYINPDFPERADDLEARLYSFSDVYHFRAGSYGGYNQWRDELARMVGTTTEQHGREEVSGPFHELINMSDCEGVIGPKTCAKLYKDFCDWEPTVCDNWPDRYNVSKYLEWKEAFRRGAENGFVAFR